MNKFKEALDQIEIDYPTEDGHDNLYQCYLVAFQIYTAMKGDIDSELVNDIPEFVALNKAIYDITEMRG